MQNHKDKQSIIQWDNRVIEEARSEVIIEISAQEWDNIVLNLRKKLSELSDEYLKQQADTSTHQELRALFANLSPELVHIAKLVSEKIQSGYRFCILRGLRFHAVDAKVRDLLILGFSCLIGTPSATDKIKKIVLWPVKPESTHAVENTTFSQRIGEAEYHTDTQYFEKPEKYMSLWCINPDKNGGGESGLLDGRMLLKEIEKRYGHDVINVLTRPVFPFRVPSVFTNKGNDENAEIYYGSIFDLSNNSKPFIRYRRETLEKGVIAAGISLSKEQMYALQCVENVIQDTNLEFKCLLEKGDVIFADNHELLHMRTYFDDLERFLIRVRFNISS